MCLDKAYILRAQFQNQTKHCWSLNDFLIVLGNLDALRSDTASIAGQLMKEVSLVKMVSKMLYFLKCLTDLHIKVNPKHIPKYWKVT